MPSQQQLEERKRRSERIFGLSRAVSQFPRPAARSDRAPPSERAKNAIRALGFALETLADPAASQAAVADATRVANAAYQATNLGGETFVKHAAMELVADIRAAAAAVLDEGARIEDLDPFHFAFGVRDSVPTIDVDAFRAAVGAWVGSEQAMRKRGRRRGRTPNKWGPTFDCLKRFGLSNGITSAENLRRTWRAARPHAIPLSESTED